MTFFRRLQLTQWQQFRSVDIEFHDRLTVITGANASGKTTLLNLLGRHTNWDVPSLAVPRRSPIEGVIRFFSRFFGGENRSADAIGTLTYSTGREARFRVPDASTAPYQVQIENQQSVPCFVLPSHRAVYRYHQVTQIPGTRLAKQQAFARVWDSTRNRYFGGGGCPKQLPH